MCFKKQVWNWFQSVYKVKNLNRPRCLSLEMEIPFGSSSTPNRALFSSNARFLKERRKKKRKNVGCFSQRRVLSRVACNGSNGKRTSDHWYSFNWMECVDFVARILLAGQKSVPLPSRPWEKCVRTCVFSPFFSLFFASVFSKRIETFDHDTMRVFFFFFNFKSRFRAKIAKDNGG